MASVASQLFAARPAAAFAAPLRRSQNVNRVVTVMGAKRGASLTLRTLAASPRPARVAGRPPSGVRRGPGPQAPSLHQRLSATAEKCTVVSRGRSGMAAARARVHGALRAALTHAAGAQ